MQRRALVLAALMIALMMTVAAQNEGAKPDPIGEWALDEGSGQWVYDETDNNNHGTLGYDDDSGPYDPIWRHGDDCIGEHCLEFINHMIRVPYNDGLDTEDVTLAAWVYPTSYAGSGHRAIMVREYAYKLGLIRQGWDDHGYLAASFYNEDEGGWVGNDKGGWTISSRQIPKDQWTHVAATWDGNTVRFYVNGERIHEEQVRSSYTPIKPKEDRPFSIGARRPERDDGPLYMFRGRIDSAVRFNEDLDDDDIEDIVDDDPEHPSAPETSDDYIDDRWESEPQDVMITCSDDDGDCRQIDWRIVKNGTVERSGTHLGDSVTVTVGKFTDGELTLEYRGIDQEDNIESWNQQQVRVDKQPPITVIDENPGDWRNDDFTVAVSDTEETYSGYGMIDLSVLVDTSPSFFGEISELEETLETVEEDVERDTGIKLRTVGFALNNTYDVDGGADRGCKTGQTLPGDLSCEVYSDAFDYVTDVKPYLDWAGIDADDYDGSRNHGEAPAEAWGMGIIDVVQRDHWIGEDVTRAILVMGDHDANGGSHINGHPGCGDSSSYDLASYIDQLTGNEDIAVIGTFGMYQGDEPECANPPQDDQYNWVVEEQLATLGPVSHYDDTDEVVQHMKSLLDELEVGACEYRIKDGDSGWTDWKVRDCPSGNVELTVGADASNDCTTNGEDACVVQTRVRDRAGNVNTDTKRFNIDMVPPETDCDDCATPDPVTPGSNVTFTPDVDDAHSGTSDVVICRDESCEDPYCQYYPAVSGSCKQEVDRPYGHRTFCVRATDSAGNTALDCDPTYTVEVAGGDQDPCQSDDECVFDNCDSGVCTPWKVSPPEIILH